MSDMVEAQVLVDVFLIKQRVFLLVSCGRQSELNKSCSGFCAPASNRQEALSSSPSALLSHTAADLIQFHRKLITLEEQTAAAGITGLNQRLPEAPDGDSTSLFLVLFMISSILCENKRHCRHQKKQFDLLITYYHNRFLQNSCCSYRSHPPLCKYVYLQMK